MEISERHKRKRPYPFRPKATCPSLKLEDVLNDLFPCSRAFVKVGIDPGHKSHKFRLSMGRELLGLGLTIEEATRGFEACDAFNKHHTISQLKSTNNYLKNTTPYSPWSCKTIQKCDVLSSLCERIGYDICKKCRESEL